MSLDGYIAGPSGGVDWIPEEPTIDWAGFLGRFDVALMGRGTYETAVRMSGDRGQQTYPSGIVLLTYDVR